jgi:AraC-like DNA-binding protein
VNGPSITDSPMDHRAADPHRRALSPGRLLQQRPQPALARFIDHYWLCLDNGDSAHPVLPDGCIDLVLELGPGGWRSFGYGCTTRPTLVPCVPGRHYLGIRLRPAQHRHFLRASAAELTDRSEDARHLLPPGVLAPLADQAAAAARAADAFAAVERGLLALPGHDHRAPPGPAELMVRHIEAAHGALRIDALARQLGRSPRQLQRVFLEQVGIPAKFFACIVRLRRARALLASGAHVDLADVAAQAGYADQSHMTRDFSRLAGCSPAGQPARVVFLQDAPAPAFAH